MKLETRRAAFLLAFPVLWFDRGPPPKQTLQEALRQSDPKRLEYDKTGYPQARVPPPEHRRLVYSHSTLCTTILFQHKVSWVHYFLGVASEPGPLVPTPPSPPPPASHLFLQVRYAFAVWRDHKYTYANHRPHGLTSFHTGCRKIMGLGCHGYQVRVISSIPVPTSGRGPKVSPHFECPVNIPNHPTTD